MELVFACQVVAVAGSMFWFYFHILGLKLYINSHFCPPELYHIWLSFHMTAEDEKLYPANGPFLQIEKSELVYHWLSRFQEHNLGLVIFFKTFIFGFSSIKDIQRV